MGWVLEREGAGITIQKTTESWVCRAGDFCADVNRMTK